MGACSAKEEDANYGISEHDMELQTTKGVMTQSFDKPPTRSRRNTRSQLKDLKVCDLDQNVYPEKSEMKTPSTQCIWTQSYEEAIKEFDKKELDKIKDMFLSARAARVAATAAARTETHPKGELPDKQRELHTGVENPESNETQQQRGNAPGGKDAGASAGSDGDGIYIEAREFLAHFSNYFDNVGRTMGKQLFDQLSYKAGKAGQNSGSHDELHFKPLVSALYMWQKGTMRDKLVLLFDMWDVAPKDGRLSKREITSMVRAASRRHTASTCMMMEALHLDVGPFDIQQVLTASGSIARNGADTLTPHMSDLVGSSPPRRGKKMPKIAGKGPGDGDMQPGDKYRLDDEDERQVALGHSDSESKLKRGDQETDEKDAKSGDRKSAQKPKKSPKSDGWSSQDDDEGEDNNDIIMFPVDGDHGLSSDEDYVKEHMRYDGLLTAGIDDEIELFVGQLFEAMDNEHDGLVSLPEWLKYASGDKDIDEFLEHFTLDANY